VSEHFEMLVDPDVSMADAAKPADQLVVALRDTRLITGDLSSECVLGGSGYHVGPGAQEIYQPSQNEVAFHIVRKVSVGVTRI